jgi:hypothetical protein
MVKNYVGGVKQVDLSVSSFTSVMSFLQKSKVSSVSYSSRFGFIFKAELKPGLESDFLELNDSKKEFDKPVTTLIFKIAILMKEENYNKIKDKPDQLPVYKDTSGKENEKSVESYDNFIMEAKVQNEVYEKTVSKGQPLCPALIDVSSISELREARSFLDLMNCTDDSEAKNMKGYLLETLKTSQYETELGIITMSSALDYMSFSSPLVEKSVQLYSSVVYSVIRLLNETQRVHGDLNKGNVMIKQLPDGRYISLLIDFNSVFLVTSMSEKQKQLSNSLQPFFMDENGSFVINKSMITLNKNQFTEEDVKLFIEFISALDKAYHVTTRDMEEEQNSLFEKHFLTGFTSYADVANMLNSYYELPDKVSYKNKMVDFDENMDKTSTVALFLQLKVQGSPSEYEGRNPNAPPSVDRRKRSGSISQMSMGDDDVPESPEIKKSLFIGDDDDESPNKKQKASDYNLLPKGGRKFTKKRRVRRKTMKRSKKPKKKTLRKTKR